MRSGSPGGAVFRTAWEEGRATTLEQAVAYALGEADAVAATTGPTPVARRRR